MSYTNEFAILNPHPFLSPTGGTMQKYSYHAGSSTVCGRKSKSSTKKRHARQTEMSLGAEINIKLALKGFPSSVTSAVSVPSPKKADGYDYFLFAGRKSMTMFTMYCTSDNQNIYYISKILFMGLSIN